MITKVEHSKIWESCVQKILGVLIDQNLKI